MVVVVVVAALCGHNTKPFFWTFLSEDHEIDPWGTIPLGPAFPLYASPLTISLSYLASV
jgi:hypothetical protein